LFIENRVFLRRVLVTLCGPDGRKLPTYYEGIELLSPGIKPSEAFMVLDYRRKRDLE